MVAFKNWKGEKYGLVGPSRLVRAFEDCPTDPTPPPEAPLMAQSLVTGPIDPKRYRSRNWLRVMDSASCAYSQPATWNRKGCWSGRLACPTDVDVPLCRYAKTSELMQGIT